MLRPATPSEQRIAGDEPRLIQQRFALRHRLADTALAEVFRANDLHQATPSMPENMVLLLLVKQEITALPGFKDYWLQVLGRQAPPTEAYPDIRSFGEENGLYWIACNTANGTLLSEQIREAGSRGLPLDQALSITENISQATRSIQAGAFGYLEPGMILKTDKGFRILNAPLVKILHQFISRNNSGSRYPLALHSSYLSPSVAVGDVPTPEDDSFSVACLLQTLLTGQPPYGTQSTLAAAAHVDKPATCPPLKADSQEILRSALAMQRSQRPESPEVLLQGIRKKSRSKVLFPVALLAAIGVVAYASHHLLTRVEQVFDAPPVIDASTTTTATTPESAPATQAITETPKIAAQAGDTPPVVVSPPIQPTVIEPERQVIEAEPEPAETTPVEQATKPEPAETKAVEQAIEQAIKPEPAETPPEPKADIAALLAEAKTEMDQNRLTTSDGKPGALPLLRQAWAVDRQNPELRTLLNQLLEKQQDMTGELIRRNKLDEARNQLAATDELMREFVLTAQIQTQIRLESDLEIREQEQKQATDLLAKARTALKRGRLSSLDNRNDNALDYLNRLMFLLPNHQEGHALLDDLVSSRLQTTRTLLEQKQLGQADSYLEETRRIVSKYNLTRLKKTQASLDQSFQAAMTETANSAPARQSIAVPATEATPVLPDADNNGQNVDMVLIPPPINAGDGSLNPQADNQSAPEIIPMPDTETETGDDLPLEQRTLPPRQTGQEDNPPPAPVQARPYTPTPNRRPQPTTPAISYDPEPPAAAANLPAPDQPPPADLPVVEYVPFIVSDPNAAVPELEPVPFDPAPPITQETVDAPPAAQVENLDELPVQIIEQGLSESR